MELFIAKPQCILSFWEFSNHICIISPLSAPSSLPAKGSKKEKDMNICSRKQDLMLHNFVVWITKEKKN